jgi:ribosomal protein S18 acetylase RimI-like enzyme
MSAFKFLIDTNIVIGLEDNRPIEAGLTDLTRQCSANGVRLFVDAAVDDDIQRDPDLARRAVTLSKLEKFERLKGIIYPDDAELARRYGPINSLNDRSDCRLLFCVERKAADFLITRDVGLHRRARRVGFGDNVLSAEDALVWLRQTFEPAAVDLPYVAEREAYAVDKSDSLFDGLRADYPDFDKWYDEKCAREHRKCWVVDVSGAVAGVVIRKDETRSEAKVIQSAGERILKLCTFIMGSRFRGEKFGEQLLKQCLWFAQANSYDVVYVTAFPSKDELIRLFVAYGFTITGRQDTGEFVIEKVLKKGPLPVDNGTDILALDRASYPRFYDGIRAAKYCVPIQGTYHEKLFPEISFRPQPPLFAASDIPRERTATRYQERTPGNTSRKVYLCRAQAKGLKPGDILLFYLSRDRRLAASQSLTTVGVVEQCRESRTADELVVMTARRSVFSAAQLSDIPAQSPTPVKVIDFLLVGHMTPPIGVGDLVAAGVFNGRPPQSIAHLHEARYQRLRPMLKLGFEL